MHGVTRLPLSLDNLRKDLVVGLVGALHLNEEILCGRLDFVSLLDPPIVEFLLGDSVELGVADAGDQLQLLLLLSCITLSATATTLLSGHQVLEHRVEASELFLDSGIVEFVVVIMIWLLVRDDVGLLDRHR